MAILALDHVQLAMPAQQEQLARAFYSGILGMHEVAKPPELAQRGGAWFEAGSVQLHLGIEADFRPARKAHPALLVDTLDHLVERCQQAGYTTSSDVPLAGYRRMHVFDPFGNRIELLEAIESGVA
ncbi:MAG: VOC family protein [Roseiflexaceae bacterium]